MINVRGGGLFHLPFFCYICTMATFYQIGLNRIYYHTREATLLAEVQMVFTKVNGSISSGDPYTITATPYEVTEHGKMYFVDTYGVSIASEDLSIGSIYWGYTVFWNLSLQTRNNNTEDWVEVYTELIKVVEGTDADY